MRHGVQGSRKRFKVKVGLAACGRGLARVAVCKKPFPGFHRGHRGLELLTLGLDDRPECLLQRHESSGSSRFENAAALMPDTPVLGYVRIRCSDPLHVSFSTDPACE